MLYKSLSQKFGPKVYMCYAPHFVCGLRVGVGEPTKITSSRLNPAAKSWKQYFTGNETKMCQKK